jgi:predicted acylesterase/phospholipase RssA
MIEHLVISGAGPNVFIQLGILENLHERSYFSMSNIKSIYGTSAGAIISILLILGVTIPEMKTYVFNRPWHKLFVINFMQLNEIKGLISSTHLQDIIKPFMLANDIPETYTLLDLYTKSGIDFHAFTTNVNDLVSVDLNHVTFPNMKLTDVVMLTASLPPLFSPVKYNDVHYMDGGVLNNCPIHSIQTEDYTNILIIDITTPIVFSEEFSFIEYIQFIVNKSLNILCEYESNKQYIKKCPHYFYVETTPLNLEHINKSLIDLEYRKILYDIGYNYAITH